MEIFFLGTNGWFPSATGNTTCAAFTFQDRLIVLDAGDGFHKLPALMRQQGMRKADVFLSHLHIDHIAGLHTLPLMPEGFEIRIFAHKRYKKALARFIAHPYTALPSEEYAKVSLHSLQTGQNNLPYSVTCLPLKHADPCFGYRFDMGGNSIAYCTDTGPCRNISRLGKGADLLITECALLPGAGNQRVWPHLSPEAAAREAKKAGAAKLALTHFDAKKYSSAKSRILALISARKIFPNTVAASDNLSFSI